MAAYLARRLGVTLIQLVVLLVVSFMLIHLVPGNPVRTMLGARATPAEVKLVSDQLGLGASLPHQFFRFLQNVVTFHPGQDFVYSESIGKLIGSRIAVSAELILGGIIVAVVIGAPLGMVAALKAQSGSDQVIRGFVTFVFAMPSFWIGLMLALLFSLRLHWLPSSGYSSSSVGSLLRSLALPCIALGLSMLAVVVRTLRGSVREVLRAEYIEAARTRGYSEARVVLMHVLRNAVMPTVTVLAVNIGFLIGGTVVIEQVFQLPGLGSLLFQAVESRDYPLVEYITLVAGATVVALTLLVDLIHLVVDPKVRIWKS